MLRPASPRRARRLLLLTVCLSLLGITAVASALTDPWPTYQGQTTCSPTAKPGTRELAAYLQNKYPGSGSYGISRACSSGGKSEHKEGRAFDWRVNVNNAKEKAYAQDFIRRVIATDAQGNKAALARRMGIMYVIWNDRIYSSSRQFAPRAYLNAGCRSLASCSPTLRHRNHVHISLTWRGARAQTSWYGNHSVGSGGGSTPPKPNSPPPPTVPDSYDPNLTDLRRPMVMTAAPGRKAVSQRSLRKGQKYKIIAFGVQRFGAGHQVVADAACVWNGAANAWQQRPTDAVRKKYGDPELRVNGAAVLKYKKCTGGQHVYAAVLTAQRKGPVVLTMGGRDQDQGAVRVVVARVSAPVRDWLPSAPTASRAPEREGTIFGSIDAVRDDVRLEDWRDVTWSDEVLQEGVGYRVTVTGTRRIAEGVTTDGQCLALGGRWEPRGSMDLFHPGQYHGALYIGGVRFAGSAPAEDPTGCLTHTHSMTYTPSETGRVALRIWDPTGTRGDDGTLSVRFDRLDPVPLPTAGPTEAVRTTSAWTRDLDDFEVRANDADGNISTMRLRVGAKVVIRVSGTARVSPDRRIDASCVTDRWGWAKDLGLASGQDLFGLYVDGQEVAWRSTQSSEGDGCAERHTYVATYTATKSGPLRLAIADLDYGDNGGELNVRLDRQ